MWPREPCLWAWAFVVAGAWAGATALCPVGAVFHSLAAALNATGHWSATVDVLGDARGLHLSVRPAAALCCGAVRTVALAVEQRAIPERSAPLPLVEPSEYSGPANKPFRLQCRAPSADAALSWSRAGGAPLPRGALSAGGALLLLSPRPDHSGVYECRSSRPGLAPATAEARVTITASPAPPAAFIRVEPEHQTVPQGTTAELRCVVVGASQPAISWMRVAQPLPSGAAPAGPVLRIPNVAVLDGGVYICSVSMPGRPPAQATSVLEVEPRGRPSVDVYPGPQRTVVAGGSALMQCQVTGGFPIPTVRWTRSDGRPLSASVTRLNGGILRFEDVTLADEGKYLCTAEGPAGVATVTVELDVQEKPRVSLSPPSPVTAVEGQRVRLECRASGDPTPALSWWSHKPGGSFNEFQAVTAEQPHTAVYEINRVTKSDEGPYMCRATNAAGRDEERLLLIVKEGNGLIPGGSGSDSQGAAKFGSDASASRKDLFVPANRSIELKCTFKSPADKTIFFPLGSH